MLLLSRSSRRRLPVCRRRLRPELSQMGPLHPLEFFAESIINPNAVVSAQYRDADGKSTMPSYNEKMTVQELIDVSAYLASLKPPATAKFVKGTGKIIAVVPAVKRNRDRPRRDQRFHGRYDHGLQSQLVRYSRDCARAIGWNLPRHRDNESSQKLTSSSADMFQKGFRMRSYRNDCFNSDSLITDWLRVLYASNL